MKAPLHESGVPWETWYAGTDRELRARPLCDVGGRAAIGVGVIELAPGADTRPAHFHSHEEEHLYVLSGTGTLYLGDGTHALRAGSYACFPAGQAAPHFIRNTGAEPLRYLMVGARIAEDRVTYRDTPTAPR